MVSKRVEEYDLLKCSSWEVKIQVRGTNEIPAIISTLKMINGNINKKSIIKQHGLYWRESEKKKFFLTIKAAVSWNTDTEPV